MITGSQLRAARGILNLSVAELADRTGLAVNTIRRAEGTNGMVPINAANAKLIVSTFDAAGILFIPADELGPGVRLKRPEEAAVQPRRRPSSNSS